MSSGKQEEDRGRDQTLLTWIALIYCDVAKKSWLWVSRILDWELREQRIKQRGRRIRRIQKRFLFIFVGELSWRKAAAKNHLWFFTDVSLADLVVPRRCLRNRGSLSLLLGGSSPSAGIGWGARDLKSHVIQCSQDLLHQPEFTKDIIMMLKLTIQYLRIAI